MKKKWFLCIFKQKNTLKSNRYNTFKHPLNQWCLESGKKKDKKKQLRNIENIAKKTLKNNRYNTL